MSGSETLLGAIIGATVTLWAIGMAVYAFIYQYFWMRHLDKAWAMANYKEIPTPEMKRRLCQNLMVVLGYTVAGLLSFLTIGASVVALLSQNDTGLALAVGLFFFTLAWFLGLFTFELLTTVKQLGCLLWKFQGRVPGQK